MLSAIQNRRSIRRFSDRPVPRELVEEVLLAGTLAPSSKNRQPWRFIVSAGEEKERLLAAMARGLERERVSPLLPESAPYRAGAEHTLSVMRQAPVNIFVMNPLGAGLQEAPTPEQRIYEICNAQSVGAALENMSLAAEALGLGSLWICDTYFAYRELVDSLGGPGELFAALALGWAAESPAPRPRKHLDQVVDWRTD